MTEKAHQPDPLTCPIGAGLTECVRLLEISDARQWHAIAKLANRLPPWTTILLSILTGCLCSLLTYVGVT